MTNNWRSMLALGAMVFLGWFVATQSTSTGQNAVLEKSPTWQYHVEIDGTVIEKKADELGQKGWELVTVFVQKEGDIRAVYKRKSN